MPSKGLPWRNVGKQPLKFEFELHLSDVRALPSHVHLIAVSWERSGKVLTTKTVPTHGDDGRWAKLDMKLRSAATLYRDAKRATIGPKPSTVRLVDMSASLSQPVVLGSAELDLAECASLEASAPPVVKQLQLETASKISATLAVHLQLSVSSLYITPEEARAKESGTSARDSRALSDGSPSESGATEITDASSGSMSSNALTHDALERLDEQAPMTRSLTSSSGKLVGSKWSKGGAMGNKEAAGRITELAKLLSSAQEEARTAETRLATLQHRLRIEVLQEVEETLETGAELKKNDEIAKLFNKQLLAVCDQVERIAYDNGGSLGGGGGVSLLEAEVLQLRRDLAAAKVELAMAACERDELEHVSRRLNKQLADLGAQQHCRGSST